MNDPVIIVGAGVSGLRVASLLTSKGIACKVIEARDRIGGRVLSKGILDRPEIGHVDLGPTWFWPQYEPTIARLVAELNLQVFEQYTKGAILFEQSETKPIERHMLPETENPKSARLVGGIGSLVDAIAATLPKDVIELSTKVTAVHLDEGSASLIDVLLANGQKKTMRAKVVILALPPRIIAEHIIFSPPLPQSLVLSLKEKSTWMAGHAKVVAVYERPFWREDGLSGQVISRIGLLQEIHDASPLHGQGALFGFFGMPPELRQQLGEEKVLALVVDQLTRLFGTAAENPIALLYKDWATESSTAVLVDLEPLTSFPNYGLAISASELSGNIVFAGTETSSESGGHLDGALISAERAVSQVLVLIK